MRSYKKNIFQFIIVGVLVFVVGIFIGYVLNENKIFSIQGYLFNNVGEVIDLAATDGDATDANATDANVTDENATDANATDANATDANATDANATDANATDANATDANATDANATDANATDANASIYDNILELVSFSLSASKAPIGSKVNVNIETSGACNSGVSIVFKNKETKDTWTVIVDSITDNPYIIIPSKAVEGTYEVTDLLLTGTNSDSTTFTSHYSVNDTDETTYYDFNQVLTITNPSKKIELINFKLKTSTAKIGDKVNFEISASDKLESVKIILKNETDETIVAFGKNLESNPYFEIPSSTKPGDYQVSSVTLISPTNSVVYSDSKTNNSNYYDFNIKLTIKEETKNSVYIYNNEEITKEIIEELTKSPKNTIIKIDAYQNPIIKDELFDLIDNSKRQLIIKYGDNETIFAGNDINNSKSIDSSIDVNPIEKDSTLSKLIEKGIEVKFADNGNLPGKALVRIKATNEIINVLGDSKIHVYYYDEINESFSLITNNIERTTDGYYEFEITHNSKYVLVDKEIDESLIEEEPDNVVSFLKSDNFYLLLIVGGLFVVMFAIVVILLTKKQK